MRTQNKNLLVSLLFGSALACSFSAVAYTKANVTANADEVAKTAVSIDGDTIQIGNQTAKSVTVDVNGVEETIALDIQDGASVRLSDTTGIRFTSFVSKADYEDLKSRYTSVKFGAIFKQQTTATAFEYGDAGVGYIETDKLALYDEEKGVLRYCSAIDSIPDSYYDTTVYARAYVAVTVDNTTYYGYTDMDAENGRHIDEVATSALLGDRAWTDNERYLLENFSADKVSGTVTVDCSSDEWLSAFAQDAVKVTESAEEKSTAVSKSVLDEFDDNTAGNKTARSKTYTVYTADDVYKTDALVVTKVIKTAEELANLQSYTPVTEMPITGVANNYAEYGKSAYSYGGYFVLANDITATGSESAFKALALGNYSSGATIKAEMGFHGTFDGQGHTVDGFSYDVGGVFGEIGDNAVIQNVAFTNATVGVNSRQYAVGVLSSNATGTFTVSNVYVQGSIWGANGGMLFGKSISGGTLTDVVVDMKISDGTSATGDDSYTVGAIASTDRGNQETYNNVTVIYSAETANDLKQSKAIGAIYNYINNGKTLPTEYQKQADGTVKEITEKTGSSNAVTAVTLGDTATKADFSAYSEDSWTIFAGYAPVFNQYLADGTQLCNITMKTLDLEVASNETLGAQLLANAKSAGFIGDESVTKVVLSGSTEDIQANVGSDASGFLKTTDTTATTETDRTKTFDVYTQDGDGNAKVYRAKAFVATKVIKYASELASLQSYTTVTEIPSGATTTTWAEYGKSSYSYGGYFVLANDITATGSESAFKAPALGNYSSGATVTSEMGFHGTFDGRGYKVDGFSYDVGGVFGEIGDNAVIKNVAFTNATVGVNSRQNAVGLLSSNATGTFTVSNVYVQGSIWGSNCGMLFGRSIKGGTLTDVVVDMTIADGTSATGDDSYTVGAIAGTDRGFGETYNNVTVIYSKATPNDLKQSKVIGSAYDYANGGKTLPTEYQKQADGTVKEITEKTGSSNAVTAVTLGDTATVADFANYDSTYWTVTAGYAPVFKTKA